MKIVFFNIAWMKYYKGIADGIDVPKGGGSFVAETGVGHEVYNFLPTPLLEESTGFEDGEYCLGFVETKDTAKRGIHNQLHIEKIDGCSAYKDDSFVEDVLVIFCATHPDFNFTSVVGWYKHATVFRNYESIIFGTDDDSFEQSFTAIAKTEDCVLIPESDRRITMWKVPRKQSGCVYGFGRSNIWFANGREDNKLLDKFLNELTKKIENYDGENWLRKFPDEQI